MAIQSLQIQVMLSISNSWLTLIARATGLMLSEEILLPTEARSLLAMGQQQHFLVIPMYT